ncbi:Lysine biosynthesis protein LysW OS=Streptomyces microflavus OX=1919 GN=G3I39_00690 PE=4 SV=1 [Streptomyces microflavus]
MPQCETDLTVPPVTLGDNFRPECILTLRVEAVEDGRLTLEMVEVQLRDWGQ